MIVSCYDFRAYCTFAMTEIKTCLSDAHPEVVIEVQGKSYTGCAKEARLAGWLLSRDKTLGICPACQKAGKTIKDARREAAK